jgi:glycosyltransferase involved in cell wall biosynthesis
MRIAIVNLTSGGMSGGYRKYLRAILPRLKAAPQVDDILCFYPNTVNLEEVPSGADGVRTELYRPTSTLHQTKRHLVGRLLDFGPDIVFVPSARPFPSLKVPSVRMIQNMEPLVRVKGNPIVERIINYARKRHARESIMNATRVIAISGFVKSFMTEEWGIDEKNIDLIYLGAREPAAGFERPRSVPGSWDRRFLFTAGSIRPARGLEDLLGAMKLLKHSPDVAGLVIAGQAEPRMAKYKAVLDRYITRERLGDKIVWAGLLNDGEMSWCYTNCLFFVMTSRVEACPNIALEAMAHGCLCVASNNPPLPEIFGKSALYYSAGDGEDLRRTVDRLAGLGDVQARAMSAQAVKRAADFSWDKCGEQTIDTFMRVVGSSRSVMHKKHLHPDTHLRLAVVNLTSGGMSWGYRKYLREMMPRLAKMPDIQSILMAYPASVEMERIVPELDRVEHIAYAPGIGVRGIKRQLIERLQSFGPNVLFFPTARCFRLEGVPVVTMVRNMEPMVAIRSNPFIVRLVNFFREREARSSAEKSDRVIAISDFVSRYMKEEWSLEPAKVCLVTHGVSTPPDIKSAEPFPVPVFWDRRFLFTAGSIRPARGLEDLLGAMKLLKHSPDVAGLVIAGETDARMAKYKAMLDRYIAREQLGDKILWTDLLNDRAMSWCYMNCLVFVMTSRVEACPNIALEAMAHGCLCVSTESPAIPEFFQDNATYYPAGDGSRLAEVLGEVISADNERKERYRRQATETAKNYSWDVCVEKTVQVLKDAQVSRSRGL